MTEFQPSLVYGGSSGWSGTDTSRARAADADSTGKTARRQHMILAALGTCGQTGATWREMLDIVAADDPTVHHGTISGALSNLHRDGRVALLAETRPQQRSKVYVLPEHVAGRPTIAPRSNRPVAAVVKYVCVKCGGVEHVPWAAAPE
jgi:hypothetical protein